MINFHNQRFLAAALLCRPAIIPDKQWPQISWTGNRGLVRGVLRYRLVRHTSTKKRTHVGVLYYRPDGCKRPNIGSQPIEAAKAACERHWEAQQ